MSLLNTLISAVMQSAASKKQPKKLDPVQQSNLNAMRKMLDTTTDPQELQALIPSAQKYGIDVTPYTARMGITTPQEQLSNELTQFAAQFLGMGTGTKPQATPSVPGTPKSMTPTSPTYPLSAASPEEFLKKWSISFTTDGKATFTARKPQTEEEKIKDEYISSLPADDQQELAQAMLEGATTIVKESQTLDDGAVVERTVGYRRGKPVFQGPDRLQKPATETQQAQAATQAGMVSAAQAKATEQVAQESSTAKASRAAEQAAAVAEAVPPTALERGYRDYETRARETSKNIAPLSRGAWEQYNTNEGRAQIIRAYGAPRDSMGNILKTVVDEFETGKFNIRAARATLWSKERMEAELRGVDPYILKSITNRIYSDLMMRSAEQEAIDAQYDEALTKMKAIIEAKVNE